MPWDGAELLDAICDLILTCLRTYDPTSDSARMTATSLIQAVRARDDLLSEEMIANIECAYEDMEQLHIVMDGAMQAHLDGTLAPAEFAGADDIAFHCPHIEALSRTWDDEINVLFQEF